MGLGLPSGQWLPAHNLRRKPAPLLRLFPWVSGGTGEGAVLALQNQSSCFQIQEFIKQSKS